MRCSSLEELFDCLKLLIEPFWQERSPGKYKNSGTGKIVITVEEQELEEMREEAERLGFRNVGDFVMGCVRFARKDGRMLK